MGHDAARQGSVAAHAQSAAVPLHQNKTKQKLPLQIPGIFQIKTKSYPFNFPEYFKSKQKITPFNFPEYFKSKQKVTLSISRNISNLNKKLPLQFPRLFQFKT